MGDRTCVTVTVAGLDPAFYKKIETYLVDQWSADGAWNDDPNDRNGAWIIQEMSLGSAPEVAAGLRALMVELDQPFAYRIDEDPKYEWDGYWEGAIPDPTHPDGWWEASGAIDGDGGMHVATSEIDRVIDAWKASRPALVLANCERTLAFEDTVDPADILVAKLDDLTGRAWRDAWDTLDTPLPEPIDPIPDPPDHGTDVVTISPETIRQARWLADHPLGDRGAFGFAIGDRVRATDDSGTEGVVNTFDDTQDDLHITTTTGDSFWSNKDGWERIEETP